jgi:DNA-binding winged helix-turn-helix (wHTH) protein
MTTNQSHISIRYICHLFNGHLLTVEQTREILKDPELTDEQLTEIRDGYRLMAEVIFDKWLSERKTKTAISDKKFIEEAPAKSVVGKTKI